MYKNRLESLKNKSDNKFKENKSYQKILEKIQNVRPNLLGSGIIPYSEPFIDNCFVGVDISTLNGLTQVYSQNAASPIIMYNQNLKNMINGTSVLNSFLLNLSQTTEFSSITMGSTNPNLNFVSPTISLVGNKIAPNLYFSFNSDTAIQTGFWTIYLTNLFKNQMKFNIAITFRWAGLNYGNGGATNVACINPNLTTLTLTNTGSVVPWRSYDSNQSINGYNSAIPLHGIIFLNSNLSINYPFFLSYLSVGSTPLADSSNTSLVSKNAMTVATSSSVGSSPTYVTSSSTISDWEINNSLLYAQLINMNDGSVYNSTLTDFLCGNINSKNTIKQPTFYFTNSKLSSGKYYMQVNTGYGTIERSSYKINSPLGTPDGTIYSITPTTIYSNPTLDTTYISLYHVLFGSNGDLTKYNFQRIFTTNSNGGLQRNQIYTFNLGSASGPTSTKNVINSQGPSQSTCFGILLTKGDLSINSNTVSFNSSEDYTVKNVVASSTTAVTKFFTNITCPMLAWTWFSLNNDIAIKTSNLSNTKEAMFITNAAGGANVSTCPLFNTNTQYMYICITDDFVMLSSDPFSLNRLSPTNTRYIPFNTSFTVGGNSDTLNSSGYDRMYLFYSGNGTISQITTAVGNYISGNTIPNLYN